MYAKARALVLSTRRIVRFFELSDLLIVRAIMDYLRNRNANVAASVERVLRLSFFTDSVWLLVVRAMMFHKKYHSELVYIAKPLFRSTR
jgi:hypothetical protein